MLSRHEQISLARLRLRNVQGATNDLVSAVLRKNSQLVSVSLVNLPVSDVQLRLPHLTSLELSSVSLGLFLCARLSVEGGPVLLSCDSITGGKGMHTYCDYLLQCAPHSFRCCGQCKFLAPPSDFHAPSLRELDLSRTPVSDFDIVSFLQRLAPNALHTLRLQGCKNLSHRCGVSPCVCVCVCVCVPALLPQVGKVSTKTITRLPLLHAPSPLPRIANVCAASTCPHPWAPLRLPLAACSWWTCPTRTSTTPS